jgi:hypothetical protein
MRRTLLVSVLLLSVLARAEEPTVPPIIPTEQAEPAIPGQFLDLALKVDVRNHITEGKAQTPVSHRELFTRLGRADLLLQSDNLANKRKWLIISAVTLAVAGGVTGGILIGTAPKLASPACESDIHVYNDICVPRAAQHNISGTAVIATAVVGAAMLATFAYWSDPDVLNRDQTAALVSSFNAQLARNLRRPSSTLRVLPMISPDGASLTAALRF